MKRKYVKGAKLRVSTEAGLLRAAALNLGFGAVPQLPPPNRVAGPSK
jgi:hypothetical protein